MTPDAAIAGVLGAARALLPVREIGGDNRGPLVEAIQKATQNLPGQAWCASFVAYCGYAGVGEPHWPLPKTGSVHALYHAARVRDGWLLTTPLPGAIFLRWFPDLKRYAHTGFVQSVYPYDATTTGYRTIEGNASDPSLADSRDGTGVFAKNRRVLPNDRFIHWWTGWDATNG
jgi:hypothetical protein